MTYVLYSIFILACIILVVAVLLQPGKADAGALFSSGVSSTAFGPRGTQTLLAKITIGAAIVFMLVALMLSLPAITGTRSVLQYTSETPQPTTPSAPPQTQSNSNAPATTTAPAPSATTTASPVDAGDTPQPQASPTSSQ